MPDLFAATHFKGYQYKKSNKEWRATIPRNDRRFRELAKLDRGQFILGSGTLLEINAFKPGQIETFYASQQIGEHLESARSMSSSDLVVWAMKSLEDLVLKWPIPRGKSLLWLETEVI